MCTQNPCGCSSGNNLIFACSGAADVGAIADRAARQMAKDGTGKMFCAVGIGGQVESILKTTAAAAKILAIDGCQHNCVDNSLRQAGFTNFMHMQLADLGLEKGCCPVNDETINKVAAKGKEMMS